MSVIFTAYSKKNFYMKNRISRFVLEKGRYPYNPFLNLDYFLSDSVDQDKIRECNNVFLKRVDELWVFGDISDGVQLEIDIAKKLNIPIKFFSIRNNNFEEVESTTIEGDCNECKRLKQIIDAFYKEFAEKVH